MTARKLIKEGIRLVIECDGNPITVIVRLSKRQLYELLDKVLPDEDPEKLRDFYG